MESYDVVVVGVGSMGGATCRTLAGRGMRVLGLETFTPGHDQGSAHGGTRIIRQSYFEDPAYVPLLRRAYAGFRELEEESGRSLVRTCGGIYIGDPSSPTFAGSRAAAVEHGLAHEVLTAVEVRERFPTMDPADDAMAVYEAEAGYVRPEETVVAQAEVAARSGADLRFGERVRSWSVTPGGGVEVVTDQGRYGADRLVVTPGAWAPQLLGSLRLPLRVERMVFHWFTPDTGAVPLVAWDQDRHPVYVEQTHGNEQIYGFPMTDGPSGGFKLGFFRVGTPTDPDAVDRVVREEENDAVLARARQLSPHLGRPVVQAKTCLYTITPDEHFVVGRHPEHEQVSIGCGFSGHGFKFVPVMGEILADLAQHGTTPHPIGLFDPTRAALRPAPG
ncbi:sarcosine oxidase, monomeric form [Klenkia soli]|uniref:Sarcosine oxidase, monomeric form n=1 Tax=Klenkia soli TaxID=1052260 RepID=A0A1H0FVF8_9ACTN|nr:N-methyl-L-tryptophan oxidase [Klenkia soli]SDN98636.1 sarcosine oxidase, monomeric form [Klenkia soli]